jgi:hypothetical protein
VPAADRPHVGTFADRARREAERFRRATDSEYWIAFCFRTPAARDSFARAVGAGAGYRVGGSTLPKERGRCRTMCRAIRLFTDRSPRGRDTAVHLAALTAPGPAAGTRTGDLEHDSAAELAELLAALTARPDPAPAAVLDSPWWVVAWWPSREAKDAWLAATGVDVLGDKYVDGRQAAVILGIRARTAAPLELQPTIPRLETR